MIHIGKLIKQELEEAGKNESWLAEQLECFPTDIHKIVDRASIDTDTLLRISSILKHNFFLEYSQELLRHKTKS